MPGAGWHGEGRAEIDCQGMNTGCHSIYRMVLDRYASENEVVQHWERIIAALQGSQLAKIWHVFKLNAAQEVPRASSEARDLHNEGQESHRKPTDGTVHGGQLDAVQMVN